MQRVPMTLNGARQLKEELERLKTVDRPKVIDDISEARAHGDLKENAEYHAAREQQGLMEARIKEIEGKLSNAQIIDISDMENKGKVIFGSTVDLLNCDTDEEVTYTLVGEDEASIKAFKISITSPIARGLVGKEEGDIVNMQTPGGLVEFEIVAVRYEV